MKRPEGSPSTPRYLIGQGSSGGSDINTDCRLEESKVSELTRFPQFSLIADCRRLGWNPTMSTSRLHPVHTGYETAHASFGFKTQLLANVKLYIHHCRGRFFELSCSSISPRSSFVRVKASARQLLKDIHLSHILNGKSMNIRCNMSVGFSWQRVCLLNVLSSVGLHWISHRYHQRPLFVWIPYPHQKSIGYFWTSSDLK